MQAKRLLMFLKSFILIGAYYTLCIYLLGGRRGTLIVHCCWPKTASSDTHCSRHGHRYIHFIEPLQKISRDEVRHLRNRLSEKLLKRRRESLGKCQTTKRQATTDEHAPSLLRCFSSCCVHSSAREPDENQEMFCQCLWAGGLIFEYIAVSSRCVWLSPSQRLLILVEDSWRTPRCHAVRLGPHVCAAHGSPQGTVWLDVGAGALSPPCELCLNLDIASPQGKTNRTVLCGLHWFSVNLTHAAVKKLQHYTVVERAVVFIYKLIPYYDAIFSSLL